jgi:mannosyltransferase
VTTRPKASPVTQSRSSRFEVLVARGAPLVLVALTAAVSSFHLGGKGLWHDEAFTVAVASSDGDAFWRIVVGPESFAGLYYLIIRLLTPLWENESALRAPSVVFGVLTALTLYFMAKRLFSARVAVVSVLLLSVDYFFVRYAQEARAYALALWLVTLATWCLVRAVEKPTWPRWLGFAAFSALATYAHFFAVLVFISHLVSLLLHRSLIPWKKVVLAGGLTAVLVFPLAGVLMWTNSGGRPYLPQASVFVLLREIAGVTPTRLGVLHGALFALGCVGMVTAYARQRRRSADAFRLWRYTLLVCWLGIPIALGALVSLIWPVFVTRYFIVCLPALLLLVAVGLTVVRPAAQVALLLIILLIGARGLGVYYDQDHKEGENWRALVQHVAQEGQSGDGVLFLSRFGRRPFEYYIDRHPGVTSRLTPEYPSMPWGEYPPVVGEAEVDATGTRARELESVHPARVWVVSLWGGFRTGDDDGKPFQRVLTRHYIETEHFNFGRYLKLGLFERR